MVLPRKLSRSSKTPHRNKSLEFCRASEYVYSNVRLKFLSILSIIPGNWFYWADRAERADRAESKESLVFMRI
jgi:hypothetical protein